MDPHQVIIRPVISEKSYNLIETQNQYTFQVDKRANKNQIKRAIEDAFDVRVHKVNTANVKSKPKRQGFYRGRTAQWKKAVVRLAEGESIELFEGVSDASETLQSDERGAEELIRPHALLGDEGEAAEGPDRQAAQDGRAQQQRAHHDPPHRWWAQATLPAHRLQAQ